jgi:UDP-N-acetylmuramoyl-tripeptide--D-alanyl-D-alanine ligase
MAAQVADLAVFVGDHGHHAVKAAIEFGMKPECAVSFTDLCETAVYLHSELRDGDLVLLKGRATDHLSRVLHAQFGRIGCWRSKCNKRIVCDICSDLRPEFDLEATLIRASDTLVAQRAL